MINTDPPLERMPPPPIWMCCSPWNPERTWNPYEIWREKNKSPRNLGNTPETILSKQERASTLYWEMLIYFVNICVTVSLIISELVRGRCIEVDGYFSNYFYYFLFFIFKMVLILWVWRGQRKLLKYCFEKIPCLEHKSENISPLIQNLWELVVTHQHYFV